MQITHPAPTAEGETVKPPFLYEIRVKGRLSAEQWTSWFDDLSLSSRGAESTLRGSVPDHAALYGLIARLRDLAVPLVTVRVLDADAQARMARQSRRYDLTINLLLVALYLALLGGLATITIFASQAINTALALALLGAALSGLAHACWLWSGQVGWRWLTYITLPAAAIAFLVFIPLSGILPTTLGIAVILLIAAAALLYLIFYLRSRAEAVSWALGGPAAPGEAVAAPEDDAAGQQAPLEPPAR
jgi:hypothetical protein